MIVLPSEVIFPYGADYVVFILGDLFGGLIMYCVYRVKVMHGKSCSSLFGFQAGFPFLNFHSSTSISLSNIYCSLHSPHEMV